jgi:hypothetical protein
LAKWAFILQECDFDIINGFGRVNQNVDGLSCNLILARRIPLGFGGMVMWIWKET